MESTGIISLTLILINFFVTYKGLKDYAYRIRLSLDVPQIILSRDYKRLITSGFVHTGWIHFIFNMIALYSFGSLLEAEIGGMYFILIYFSSLIASNAASIYFHRNKAYYSSLGASGAVCGIVFATIVLYPDMRMGLLFIPGLRLSAWIFGLLYVTYCMLGIRSQRDNIAHDAHLTGGLAGIFVMLVIHPEIIGENLFPILAIVIPSVIFLYFVVSKPGFLILEKPFTQPEGLTSIDDRYNSSKRSKELELNDLLDKINRDGISSLSKKERERLEHLSRVK